LHDWLSITDRSWTTASPRWRLEKCLK